MTQPSNADPIQETPSTEAQPPRPASSGQVDEGLVYDITPEDVIDTPRYLPAGTAVSKQGVFFRADADGPLIPIISTPVWLSGVVQQGDTRETHLKLEWLSYGGKVDTVTMSNSFLGDKRSLSTFLYQHNIAGFSMRQVGSVSEYLRGSLMRYNAEHPPTIGYVRFGWTPQGFVIANEIITPSGIMPAHVIRVPDNIKSGLTASGDVESWVEATALLDSDKYWSHRFTMMAILGAPLLKLLKVESAILSLAGESGTGKTTIAELGLSAFGKPKALEIAPQSTEKAFSEKWRILNNLPLLCNEAATIDPRRILNIVYAATNGEPREILTQRSELRPTSKWTTLTVFTSNSHLQGLDDQQLNEAGRRRIFELTIETPLEGGTARAINDMMTDNYGHAGREFMSYVVANEIEVAEQLQSAFEWAMTSGVRAEDRFSAWIIATAKVAGEIGHNLGLLRFDVVGPCVRAVEAAKSQAVEIKPLADRVDEVITEFINAHHDHFSQYRVEARGEWVIGETRAGEVIGRYTIASNQTTLAISKRALVTWARTRGVDSQHITRYAREKGLVEKGVKLVQHGKNTRCLIVITDAAPLPAHLTSPVDHTPLTTQTTS